MKKRSKEEMAEYQRVRRGKVVTPSCNTDVTPAKCNTLNVTPVTPCSGCLEYKLEIKKLSAKIVLLEAENHQLKPDTPIKNPRYDKYATTTISPNTVSTPKYRLGMCRSIVQL